MMTEEFNEEVIADVADVVSDDLPDSSKGKWYVLHTYSGHENKVKASIEMMVENRGLQDYIFEVYIPMDETVEVDGAKRRVIKRKTFPGYVLIKMIVTEESWHLVRNIRGVTGFVGEGMDPIELTSEEIVKLGVEDIQVKLDVELGENVRVLSGPLENFTGVISEIYPDKQRVKVVVYMFGREMPVDLKYNQIQKLL